jgi:two-component system, cell cycle sensor histidine kinase and response regulator CckA
MTWLLALLPYLLALVVTLSLAAYAFRRGGVAGARPFTVSLLGQALWTLGYIFELLSDSLAAKINWDSSQFIGYFTLVLAILVMAKRYTGHTLTLSRRFWMVVLPIPCLVTAAALSEPLHHLLRSSAHIVPGTPAGALWYDFTVVDVVGMVYAYGVFVYSIALLMRHWWRGSRLVRRQTAALLLGLIVPVVVDTVLVFGFNPFPQRDPSPLVFLIGGLFFAWGLFRVGLFDILPVARAVVFESMTDGVVVVDPQGRIVDINPAASAILRASAKSSIGGPIDDLAAAARLALPSEADRAPISEIAGSHGSSCWFEVSSHALTDPAGQPRGSVLVLHDVTLSRRRERDLQAARDQLETTVAERTRALREEVEQHKQTEAALAKSERRFRAIFDQSFQFVGLLAPDGTLLDANRSALALVGARSSEVVGRPFWETPWWRHDPNEVAKLRQALTAAAQGTFVRFETTHVGADGGTRVIDFSLKAILDDQGRTVMIIPEGRDITELKQAQRESLSLAAQLHESQKLESLGRLAGGVAHDFNNLLTVIMGNLSLLQMSCAADADQQQSLRESADAARRAAELTRQLLTFSRRQIIEPRIFDPAKCLADLRNLLPRVVGEAITLEVTIAEPVGGLFMDPSQFEQIVMNLVVNARDAMPTGGRVVVTLRRVDVPEPKALPQGIARRGFYVLMSVADTGTGIAEADLPRVFEPFFTTKPEGSGTGLGLATVHGIVTRALGWVDVDTALGKGTTFHVYLPGCESGPVVNQTGAEAAVADDRSGTILVVEDQSSVRDHIVRSLRHFGFDVHAFGDGASALSYASVAEHRIDVVLTDVVMPEMGGRALADALRQLRPKLPIIFMSGHTDDTVLHPGIEDARAHFLAKPFTPASLVAKLRSVLSVPDRG